MTATFHQNVDLKIDERVCEAVSSIGFVCRTIGKTQQDPSSAPGLKEETFFSECRTDGDSDAETQVILQGGAFD